MHKCVPTSYDSYYRHSNVLNSNECQEKSFRSFLMLEQLNIFSSDSFDHYFEVENHRVYQVERPVVFFSSGLC